jgi:two-component system NtrC family sensor kinase
VKDAAELRFVRVSKAMEALAGLNNETCIGRNDYDFFPKEEADFFTRNDRAVLASGQLLEIPEEPMHTPSGMKVLHTKKIPILDDHGRPLYLLGITRDITAQKEAQEQLREKNRLLEEAVRSEHEALEALKQTQARLVQSEKMAALGQLVAGVAHEINNPLAFVSNNVNVLERDLGLLRELLALYRSADASLAAADPEAARAVAEMSERIDLPYTLGNLAELLSRSRDGLRRIQQIVRDLRDFSRHESVQEFQEGADLRPGIVSTVNIVRERARSRGVELEVEMAERLPGVNCYPAKVNQVVLNLLTNAIDACGAGGRGGKIAVRTRAADDGVEIRVADNGCGIDPAVLDKIFDPFFTTKPQGKGTGLGLSISHGIVQDHGGRISVESTPGRGSSFTVYLPSRGLVTPGTGAQ